MSAAALSAFTRRGIGWTHYATRSFSSLRAEETHDVVVVGGGVMGAWTAIMARKRGASVVLADQFPVAHERGSSHGDGRIYRMAYIEDIYVDMMLRSLPLWRELEAFAGHQLMAQTGGLQFAAVGEGRLEDQTATYLRRNIEHERLTAPQSNERFPQIELGSQDEALYQPDFGVLFASKCISAAWCYAEALGVQTVTPFRATAVRPASNMGATLLIEGADAAPLRARSVVLAPGAWISSLASSLLGLSIPTRVSAETVCYYKPRVTSTVDHSFRSMPCFIPECDNAIGNFGYYGLPMIDIPGIKCSAHYCGPEVHPDRRPLSAGGRTAIDAVAEQAAAARVAAVIDSTSRFIASRFPHVEHEPFMTQSCLYTTTPDHDYILSTVPNQPKIVLAGGGSGHGFKMGPAIGEGAAALALADCPPPYPVQQFAVERLLKLDESGAMDHEANAPRK